MAQKIEKDAERFNKIVKGKIKQNLKKYMTNGELLARKGKDLISIPIPHIQLPRFKFGQKDQGGVGSGDGEVGDPIPCQEQPGEGEAGNQSGEHALEVDVQLDELAKILGEELELPRIEPKGQKTVTTIKDKYSSLRRTGPESLRQFKKTFINALKRQISSGEYDEEDPIIVPERADRRYRSWTETRKPETNAVIIFMMDVSGSMGSDQKELVRLMAFWIEIWLKAQFDNMEIVYIIHDSKAKEVDQHRFYHTTESGGTMISSAYKEAMSIIKKRYDPTDWNIYGFHFSDGDNWGKDNDESLKILKEEILPAMNHFCYGQCKSQYGSGEFMKVMTDNFNNEKKVSWAEMESKEDIYDGIKEFLGKGAK